MLAAIGSLCLFSASASAAPDHGAGHTKTAKLHYEKQTTTHFEVEYENEEFYGRGMVRCVGRHQTSERKGFPGDETGGGRDIERCHTVNGEKFEKLVGGEEGVREFPGPENVWESDYFLFVKHESGVRTYNMTYRVARNDKSFKVIATYNE
ncbi:MAG TPA: hypothetical protein VMA83_12345 [Solirubrobacteraceae bacterium]|nr:hypothetical protein [Solirubrobacteraceae bacterium]